MGVPEIIEVLFDGGWKISFRGYLFGPYLHRRDAVETAEMWAENGRCQGLAVVVKAETPSGVTTRAAGNGSGR